MTKDDHLELDSMIRLIGGGGSSGFAEPRNLKKIGRGIRNPGTFLTERRNSSSLPAPVDFLEIGTRQRISAENCAERRISTPP